MKAVTVCFVTRVAFNFSSFCCHFFAISVFIIYSFSFTFIDCYLPLLLYSWLALKLTSIALPVKWDILFYMQAYSKVLVLLLFSVYRPICLLCLLWAWIRPTCDLTYLIVCRCAAKIYLLIQASFSAKIHLNGRTYASVCPFDRLSVCSFCSFVGAHRFLAFLI